MGIDDIKNQTEGIRAKAEDLVRTTLADEAKSDELLDRASKAVKKATGGRFDSTVDTARDAVDERVGE
ncbi:antitoxin [Actinomyces sp. B33]|uniref:antitoxin n=1 Tax=Actinomyces sp. B33 TaxID=2942131 RepID=UPI00233FE8BA|nr:antitoxin [Actinomyces sp. B33]MDC4233008.1 antitoxin [Actinomyces sp. B33]